ncbi:hypothetical protein C8R46DRAFT_105447 [Mycena filopes]|nr:hypothetical protein C8R46DRAFT_105447 [Mycena filopes]
MDTPKEEEMAGSGLWAVYISEAEKYDKKLVERWKSDMEGLLIFAGLFSASLTAFLIESYQTLSPDQGAITIAILAQISRQLEGHATAVDLSQLLVKTPTRAAMACNILWFISLGFSLSCALIATLVQQWSRDFIQGTEMQPSPIIRARIFAYLYFGLQQFGMHTIVQFIPFLLHMSLFLFFAGLIAFLFPINIVLGTIAAMLFGSILVTYVGFTAMPMVVSNSPYRTPLSAIAWGLYHHLNGLSFLTRHPVEDEESSIAANNILPVYGIPTMVEKMMQDALQESPERDDRDGRAIVWTMRSLTDDSELQPFVEALPNLVWGPNGRRHAYDRMIKMLLDTPDVQLVSRVERLLQSCENALLHPQLETRRRISCLDTLWALAYISLSPDREPAGVFQRFDCTGLESQLHLEERTSDERCHLISAIALIRLNNLNSLLYLIGDAETELRSGSTPSLEFLSTVQHEAKKLDFPDLSQVLLDIASNLNNSEEDASITEQFLQVLNSELEGIKFHIITSYMRVAGSLTQTPYEFEATLNALRDFSQPLAAAQQKWRDTFSNIIAGIPLEVSESGSIRHIDMIVDEILCNIDPDERLDDTFTTALIEYINNRRSAVFSRAFSRCNPKVIGHILIEYVVHGSALHLEQTLHAILRLCFALPANCGVKFDVDALECISADHTGRNIPSSCAMAVVKSRILEEGAELPPDELGTMMELLVPQVPTLLNMKDRRALGFFEITVEFLERVVDSHGVPPDFYELMEEKTFHHLKGLHRGPMTVEQQRRFASSLLSLVHSKPASRLLREIVNVLHWDMLVKKFQDSIALTMLHTAVAEQSTNFLINPDEAAVGAHHMDITMDILLQTISSQLHLLEQSQHDPSVNVPAYYSTIRESVFSQVHLEQSDPSLGGDPGTQDVHQETCFCLVGWPLHNSLRSTGSAHAATR